MKNVPQIGKPYKMVVIEQELPNQLSSQPKKSWFFGGREKLEMDAGI